MQREINLEKFKISNDLPIAVIAGPCQLESSDHAMFMAEQLKTITNDLGINFIFKTSFDKANRSSIQKNRGVGLATATKVFEKIKKEINCPIITDVHLPEQCEAAAEYVDILQIPAYLCRQTDLLAAAAKTGKVVNVKKGQFLTPWDVANIVGKFDYFNNKNILITERGACFGYNNLVCDMRSLKVISDIGVPVIFDATHSVQRPGGLGKSSGGDREFVEVLARAAVAVGVAAVFMEVHQDPDNAPCDGPNMVRLDRFKELIQTLMKFDILAKTSF
ncbi:MAG: 3-deoxy-8-phosphooctulonate synthase [Rickettsiales bacterium]|nr:3-deoxy-8-phosphooctulonate synthase [Rickettsiales bacterium]